MKRIFSSFVACAALVLYATNTQALTLPPPLVHESIERGWVRWLPANLPAAGYATIRNDGDKAVKLTGVDSTDYGMTMLHRSMQKDGKDTMEMMGEIGIPAHGQVKLAPGGYHLMLMNPKHSIKPGDSVHLSLHFNNGETLYAIWLVRPANATGPND
ncbi:MAG: copper chaperone PCu(A)C [Rhodanobacteraceae bacterium]